MKYQAVALAVSTLLSLSAAGPSGHRHHHLRRVTKREVPQEHSHELYLGITAEFLNKNNPKGIADPVFGLLGDAAAKNGAGQVTNLACLHQETADQAFTNAKEAKDIRGMSAALVYATLERNTQGIGQTSAACTDKAVNPEIAALKQHQDPAGATAAADNKAITLELAKQLATIGGDPMLALESGTFAPGDKADSTLKGNTCDDQNDKTGCIFTQKSLVLDATPDEITVAVAGITPTFTGGTGELKATHIDFNGLAVAGQAGGASGGAASGGAANSTAGSGSSSGNAGNNTNNGNKASNKGKSAACVARNVAANNSTGNAGGNNGNSGNNGNKNNGNSGNNNSGNDNSGNASGTNVQTFTGDLGGLPPPVIQSSGNRPFSVNGDTFVGKGAALGRSCDVQKNKCANAVNSGQLDGEVSQCDEQANQCRAAAASKKRRNGRRSVNRNFNDKRQAAGDFGSCSDPSIAFSNTLPDRKSAGFIANNQNDFNHGSAQKIGIIAGFICQRLQDSCKAPEATIQSCKTAETAAQAATQDQAAADAFNSALIGGSAAGNVTRRS
ncbi:hypothetical protein CPLU01_08011 [Colletotrichum plurivorum]|uniref:Uncharacterized protein n=1 Tax=Colletotrichum plurivorum TaxID=2175906 RepID=A0A8H6NDJ8_9PEZI|nr:hypothetical protein CPLU01_08011 [Colletotrichum plurivorum]